MQAARPLLMTVRSRNSSDSKKNGVSPNTTPFVIGLLGVDSAVLRVVFPYVLSCFRRRCTTITM